MRRGSEPTEPLGRSIGNDGSSVSPKSSRVPENEEWAWMVYEDPAFYLSKPERSKNEGG